jgi:hypothetical protein
METNPHSADDLNELARRLSEWRPETSGLSADQMLFAAGRNSARPAWGRNASLIVSGGLAVLAAVLGAGLVQEREARRDLLAQLRDQRASGEPGAYVVRGAGDIPQVEATGLRDYVAVRSALTQNPDAWLEATKIEPADGPSFPQRSILRAHSPGEMIEP